MRRSLLVRGSWYSIVGENRKRIATSVPRRPASDWMPGNSIGARTPGVNIDTIIQHRDDVHGVLGTNFDISHKILVTRMVAASNRCMMLKASRRHSVPSLISYEDVFLSRVVVG